MALHSLRTERRLAPYPARWLAARERLVGAGALAGWYSCVVTTHSPSTRHAVQTTSVSPKRPLIDGQALNSAQV